MRASLRTPLLAGLLTLIPGTVHPGTAQATAPAGLHTVLAVMPGTPSADTPTAYLLGGWQGGRWLTATQTRPRLRGNEQYRRLAPGAAPTPLRAGGPAVSLGDPCEDTFEVPVPSLPRGLSVLAPATLNAQPRPVTELPTRNATYEGFVRDELIRRGIRSPQVTLTRLTRADLDGNGTQEVIIEARHFRESSGDFPPPPGNPATTACCCCGTWLPDAPSPPSWPPTSPPPPPGTPRAATPCPWRPSTGWPAWPT
ncbi:hypothetical protein ACFQDE_06030 [Deinococcus caeni]|uniref:hypothetical protein n=1 Tax=Deinococcus caeni TaxID=569127 RepID=UPI0036133ED4